MSPSKHTPFAPPHLCHTRSRKQQRAVCHRKFSVATQSAERSYFQRQQYIMPSFMDVSRSVTTQGICMAGVKRQTSLHGREMCGKQPSHAGTNALQRNQTDRFDAAAGFAPMYSEPNLLRGQAAIITVIDKSKFRLSMTGERKIGQR